MVPHRKHRFSDYYEVSKKLGEGSFGDVHEAAARLTDPVTGRPLENAEGDVAAGSDGRKNARRHVAVKIFHLGHSQEGSPMRTKNADLKKTQSFEAERSMLADLEHPHIVRMFECFQESHNLFIVLELCRGGELYSRLVARAREVGSGGLDEPLARVLFKQMLYAVGYLHSRHIVHRDIKTENFLLVGEPGAPEADTLKLCDFGTASRLSQAKPRSMENIGTLSYTAPEVYANKGAAIAADAWSLGVVLYVMITGTNPFRSPGRKVDREETVRRIRMCEFEQRRQSWLSVSARAQDLVKRFLVLDEQQRLTCVQALRHKWLTDLSRPETLVGLPTTSVGASPATLAAYAPKVIALLLRLPRLASAQRLAVECCALAATEADLPSRGPWRELFVALDADQDGQLSFSELAEGLIRLVGNSASREQVEECARALDLDSSGAIEWVEWLVIALLSSKGISEECEPLSTAFRLIDRPAELALEPSPEDDLHVPEPIGQTIVRWVPRTQGSAAAASDGACTLQDLRFVLSSLEVYEML